MAAVSTSPSISALRGTGQPVRKTVRRLRWFKTSFNEQAEQVTADKGIGFVIHEQRQAACFIDWLRAFDAQKPKNRDSRRDYVGFAAGLMLRSLLKHEPVQVVSLPQDPDPKDPAYFWPEGYLYVAYCLSVRAAVLEQDFDEHLHLTPSLSDLATWRSFRENVREAPGLGIAFLDLFAGSDPEWEMPELFRSKDVKRIASHLMRLGHMPEV